MEKPMAGYAREVVWATELHNSGGHDQRNVRAGGGHNPETKACPRTGCGDTLPQVLGRGCL